MSSLPVVLTFGLSDATGAGGVQADQLACASMGCHPATVITAIATTARDDGDDWLAIDAELVEVQAKSVLQNMAVAAFKIGALAGAEQVQPVAEALADFADVPVVLDPVLEHSSGEEWQDEDLVEAMRELLLPQTTVVTMNLAQARAFAALGEPGESAETYLRGRLRAAPDRRRGGVRADLRRRARRLGAGEPALRRDRAWSAAMRFRASRRRPAPASVARATRCRPGSRACSRRESTCRRPCRKPRSTRPPR